MVLEGSFYKTRNIERIDDDNYNVEVELMPSHPIYAGHFPSQAVVPGVCTLTVIRESLSKILERNIVFESIKECKYISALLPQENLIITINISMTESTKLKVAVVRNDTQQSVLKLKCTIK